MHDTQASICSLHELKARNLNGQLGYVGSIEVNPAVLIVVNRLLICCSNEPNVRLARSLTNVNHLWHPVSVVLDSGVASQSKSFRGVGADPSTAAYHQVVFGCQEINNVAI